MLLKDKKSRFVLISLPPNDGSTHCSSAAHFISDSLTPVLNLRHTVVGFIFFLLLGALEVIFDSTALQ